MALLAVAFSPGARPGSTTLAKAMGRTYRGLAAVVSEQQPPGTWTQILTTPPQPSSGIQDS